MKVVSTTQDIAALGGLSTEAVDERYAQIDVLSVAELAALMNEADATVPLAVRAAFRDIVPALEAAAMRVRLGGRLVYVGAGTPGRIGVLDASEVPPTFGTEPGRVLAIIAGGSDAVVSSIEGAEDDRTAGAASIDENEIVSQDVVVGLASSGRTPFVLGAVQRARERGALTVGMSCNERTPLSALAEHPIEVLVGPEIVSGSTRLKAGTAQKLVLNMFSTIAMVQSGKTYGNLMVDVSASNVKLKERATRIVQTVAGVDREAACGALEAAGYDVKVAIVTLRTGADPDDAKTCLERVNGRLRDILDVAQ